MEKKNILSLIIGGVLVVALVAAVVLVGRNQEQRRGAYFAGTKVLLQPDALTATVGGDMLVQLWVNSDKLSGSAENAKVDGIQTMICYDPALIDDNGTTGSITVNNDAFSMIELAEIVDIGGISVGRLPATSRCLKLAVSSNKKKEELKSGMVAVATIKFKAAANGSGEFGVVKDRTRVSGSNPDMASTDTSLSISSVTGASFVIGGVVSSPTAGAAGSCPQIYGGWKTMAYKVTSGTSTTYKIRQAAIKSDGKTEVYRTCNLNYGDIVASSCTAWTEADLTSMVPTMGAATQAYIATNVYVYEVNGKNWYKQQYVPMNGKSVWSRICPSRDDGEIVSAKCENWQSTDLTTYIAGGSGSYRGMKNFAYRTTNGVWHYRESYLEMEGRYEWYRTCNYNVETDKADSCSSWVKADLDKMLPGAGGQRWAENSAHTYLDVAGKAWLRQSYIAMGGTASWYRSCPSRTDGEFDTSKCDAWKGVPMSNLTGSCASENCTANSQCGWCGFCRKITEGQRCPDKSVAKVSDSTNPIPSDQDCLCMNGGCIPVPNDGTTTTVNSPTPVSSSGQLSFKFKFGALMSDSNCVNDWKLKVIVLGEGQTKMVTDLVPVKDGDAYRVDVDLAGFRPRVNLAVFVKGPKHLQMKFGIDGQDKAYGKAGGEIAVIPNKVYDFSGYPLLPGDVTGSTVEVQDGVVNGIDFTYVKTKALALVGGDNLPADLDGNCLVNSNDVNVLKISLSEKQGELY